MPLLPRRLDARILFVVSAILLTTGVTSGWLTARLQTASLLAEMRIHSSIMTRNFAESCARYLLVQDYAELESFLLKSAALPDILRLQVCEPDGTLIGEVEGRRQGPPQVKTGLARLTPPSTANPIIVLETDRLVIWQPIVAGSLLGWIRADFSLGAIQQAQAGTWQQTLLLSLAWVVCSAILILLVLRPIVQSIRRLTSFAMQLDERKGAQIVVGRSPVEIAALGDSLNAASARLSATERQLLAERERLRNSEAMYRSLVTTMAEGVVFQSANGTITAVNPAAEAIEGRSADQMLGKTSDDPQWGAVHEDGRPFPGELHPAMVTLRTGAAQSDVIMGIHRPDDTLVWISVNSQPLIAPGETRPYAVVTTFRDITEHRRAEASMRAREREFRTLAENSPDVIIRYDRQCRRVYVNPAFERETGIPVTAALGAGTTAQWRASIPFDEYTALLNQVMDTGAPAEILLKWPDRQGNAGVHALRVVPERGVDGAVQGVLVIGRNITALREAELHFRNLVENWPDEIARYDLECRQVYVNPFMEMSLAPDRGLLGRTPTEAYPDSQEFVFYEARLRQVLATGAVLDFEIPWGAPAANPGYRMLRLVPELDTDGKVTGVFAIARDITARKHAEEALHRLNAELEVRVKERTAELEAKNLELGRLNRLFVGRELRMVELKEKLRALAAAGPQTLPGAAKDERNS